MGNVLQPQLRFNKGAFYFRCSFNDKKLAQDAKFRFVRDGIWVSESAKSAARLREYADLDTKNQIDRIMISVTPWAGRIPYPENLEPLDFQIDAARFALERNRSYIAADPGLGKTIMAALIVNALEESGKSYVYLYVCPPFLTRNTEEEIKKWRSSAVRVVRYANRAEMPQTRGMTILSDSMVWREPLLDELKRDYFPRAKEEGRETVLILDEAHRYKNEKAHRTKAVLTLAKLADKVVYLSGTPMRNGRPIELFPIFSASAPEVIDFRNRFEYGVKYCGAFQNQFGWDFNGSTNVPELTRKMKEKFMLRLRKELLKNLPPKLEEIVVLEDEMPPVLASMERKILDAYHVDDLTEARILRELEKDSIHRATYRRHLGLAKLISAVKFIREELLEGDQAFLVFAYHREVIARLEDALLRYNPITITGETPMQVRHERVAQFQNGPARVFIGQNQAAGEGITLTKATRVILLEPSWVDGENQQDSDRAHRIGQNGDVLVQYLVYKNSLDKAVLEKIFRTRKTTNQL